MDVKAAVAMTANKPLTIATVQLEEPKAGEVLVEIKATGICHTDAYTLSGADPEGLFPAILGHEGAGVVVEVGAGVTSVKAGDRVIPLYTPECRQCEYCLSRKTNLCQAIRSTQGRGVMPDGTSRFSIDGQMLHHYMGTSTFANYTVLPEIAVAKIREDAPFDKVCYIGCGVTTGVGAVINTAKVEPGANVVVFGLGGIGLNVIQAARMVGANMIVGVDTNPNKRSLAEKFGMTHFVNPKEVEGDLVPYLVDLTKGGADYSFECIGNVNVMRQALIAEMSARAEVRKAEAKRLSELAAVDEKRARLLKERLKWFFETHNLKAVETARYRLSVAKNGGKAPLILNDGITPTQLPERFVKVSIDPDTTAIREALEAGEQLDFATLGDRGTSLRIK